jgi:hypothetical protein
MDMNHTSHSADTTNKGTHGMENMDMGNVSHSTDTAANKGTHDMGNMDMGNMQHGADTSNKVPGNMEHMDRQTMDMNSPGMNMHMNSALSLNLPMSRDGSGTSWLPDASPMYGYMIHANGWMFMFHGDIFIRYNRQDLGSAGSRGGEKWDAPDMLMAMGQKQVGKNGLFHFNTMFSTDAIIAGGSGYPLLFQTGESWHGYPLVDRQHPHDLFSELSVSYAYAISKKADISVYVGYPGEPALGPVTFMHRPSGAFMPDAPISHHWADATHITFGVATIGLRYSKFKLEGSSFTGREPDEDRYNFDKPLFDSWSGRLLFNPSPNWVFQVSHGFIKSPEALHPNEDIDRNTASATYVVPFAKKSTYFSATALWGQNKIAGQDPSNSFLAEAMMKWKRTNIYTRYEWVQKTSEELNLDPLLFEPVKQHPVNAATLGAGYDLLTFAHITVVCGGQFTFNFTPADLQNLYGNTPVAGEIYLHFYPARM